MPLSVTKQQNRIITIENDLAGDAIGNLSYDNGDGKNLHIQWTKAIVLHALYVRVLFFSISLPSFEKN